MLAKNQANNQNLFNQLYKKAQYFNFSQVAGGLGLVLGVGVLMYKMYHWIWIINKWKYFITKIIVD